MAQDKGGRPKRQQTQPYIFERTRGRVERTISMSPKTAADLDRYVKWAAELAGAKEEEAMTLASDHAFNLLFARDHLFRESAEDKTDSRGAATIKVAGPSTSAPPAKPSLPPPAPTRSGVTS